MFGKYIAIACLAATGFAATPPCPRIHKVAPGDTLAGLAGFYLGDQDYASAILVATNSRTSEKGLSFIRTPFSLSGVAGVCIPDAQEAQRSHARYATYQKAVSGMAVTQPWQVAAGWLVVFQPGEAIHVASWTRAGKYKMGTNTLQSDMWVTVAPHLQDFCKKFFSDHNADEDELTLRLEQRLGLPPAAGYTTIAVVNLIPTAANIFRPCSDPSTSADNCTWGGPTAGVSATYKAWFNNQYFGAYGAPTPNLYPWTSLGYTFDWSQKSDGEFERIGESEFVIPAGTEVNVVGLPATAQYCSATAPISRAPR